MDKETFCRAQPAAARILKQMLSVNRMAHAVLFWGPRGVPSSEAAELVAQALVCRNPDPDGFGCGKCLECRNAAEHRGIGVYWNSRLQKKNAAELQEQFSLTSEGSRVCVLENFDEATPQAANALLKFIEEPQPGITVILTAGCAKYKYNKLSLGQIGGIPRVLDAGQCNDSYSLVLIALKLKEIFRLDDINDLPIVYNIAWYEQKAVIVLLSLLYLGIHNIHLGPTLPAFLSPNVKKVLSDTFGLCTIDTVENDMEKFL